MAQQTLFFYDLETSGVNPRSSRIMQFAGQRTTLDLEPIGEPVNILVKLTPDIVPEPDAVLITGITPQQTLQDGVTEAEFLKIFFEEVAVPNTIFAGFNTIRFDDEFMRFTLYRNFYDAYEWQWKNGCSRWDLLDVVRMTRALRPEGIKWPFDTNGKPTNRLELLTELNGLDHMNAHDALSDVYATIAVAKLLKTKQPKLFDYLLSIRGKKEVQKLVLSGQPFVYTSGKYPGEFEKTTVVTTLAEHPKRAGALVYDLRHDPTLYKNLSAEKLVDLWKYKRDATEPRLPIKTLRANCSPAIAPLGVLDTASQKRLQIDLKLIQKHATTLKSIPDFITKVLRALEMMDEQQQASLMANEHTVDEQLYDGFIGDKDKTLESTLRAARPDEFAQIAEGFADERLKALTPLYKARNFPQALSDEEQVEWEKFRVRALLGGGPASRLAKYFTRLGELANDPRLSDDKRYLLEELQLYGQSIMPVDDTVVA
jgi:exodeoxyribonuclease-1